MAKCNCDPRVIVHQELAGVPHKCPDDTQSPTPHALNSEDLTNSLAAALGGTITT